MSDQTDVSRDQHMHVWEAAEFQFFYGFKMGKDFRVRSNKCDIVDAESA